MMTNVYDIFKSTQEKRSTSYDKKSAGFIVEGRMSQKVFVKRLNRDVSAAIVFDSKEGPDSASFYVLKNEDVVKTDYFIYDSVNYLIYEQIKLPDEKLPYKKFKAVECNVSFDYKENLYFGYFLSNLRSLGDSGFEARSVIMPDETSLLILPSSSSISISSSFMIEGKPWIVTEYDNISNKGISYYYIKRHFASNLTEEEFESEDIVFAPEDDVVDIQNEEISLKPMHEYEFETEMGFFSSTPKVELISRTIDKVVIKIPFGIEFVTLSFRKDGEVVEKSYSVVM